VLDCVRGGEIMNRWLYCVPKGPARPTKPRKRKKKNRKFGPPSKSIRAASGGLPSLGKHAK
jgi:hypothetical protein